jgi:plastocyanin
VLLAAAGGMAGLSPALLATARPAWAFVGTVDIVGRSFSPKVTEIEIGDKVLWRNRSDEKHTVTADSGAFDYTFGTKGAQEERRFENAGTYTYHCKFHDGMTGTVVVQDPNAPSTTTTTAPPPTTTTARPTTTTTTAPPPTTTTAPPTTTTTGPSRPPAEVSPPPVPSTAAAPPPTLATSSTTTAPPVTTTTAAPTTTTTAPPAPAQEAAPSTSPSAPPTTEATRGTGDDLKSAAGRPGRSDDGLDIGAITLISLLVAVGLFGAWTLIRVRPGRI